MKKWIWTLFIVVLAADGYGQSIDERISSAVNNGKWQTLRDLYLTEGDKLQTPLLHPLSRFFLFHFYNRPDSALYYGTELLREHQSELGGSTGNILYLMANDFARVGDFENASGILHQFNEACRTAGMDPPPLFVALENQNRMIARQGGFSVVRPERDVTIPVHYHHDRSNPGMLFVESKLNSIDCTATYDTGAGVNMISQELADRLGVRLYGFKGLDVSGIHTDSTRFAIIDSLRLGSIMYRNVPFQVVDFTMGHPEADSVVNRLNLQCVIGTQTMVPLGEIQFDFKNGNLIIPAKQTPKPDFAPNIYCSGENVFVMPVYDKKSNELIDAMLDTGASVTQLTSSYYRRNRSLFSAVTPNDSIRMAGVGGIKISKSFSTRWEYRIGDTDYVEDSVVVNADTDANVVSQYDCWLGLPTFTRHDRVIINFNEMWVRFSPLDR